MQSLANGLDQFLVVVLAVDRGRGRHGRLRRHLGTAARRIVVDGRVRLVVHGVLGRRNGHGRSHSPGRGCGRGAGRGT